MFLKLKDIIKEKCKDSVFAYQYFLTVRFIISLIISVILVKSSLSVIEIGHFEVIAFIIQILSFSWSVGIKNALLSFYPGLDAEKKKQLIIGVTVFLYGISFLFGILWACFPYLVARTFTSYEFIPYLIPAVLLLIFSIPTIMVETILFLRNDAKGLIKYTHLSQCFIVCLMICVAAFDAQLQYFLIGMVAWSIAKGIYLVIYILGKEAIKTDWILVRNFLIFSIPLIFNVLLANAMDFIDGLFVTNYFNEDLFALYRYGARELPFSSLLFSSLSAAMIPILIKTGVETNEVKIRTSRIMHWVFPIAILMMMISSFVFPIIYSIEFKESAYIFNIYLLILTSRVLLPQTYNFALQQHSIVNISSIFEIVTNILLSFWLVKPYGIYGLAMATVVSYFVQKIILIVYNHKVNNIKISQYLDIKWYIIYCVILITTFIISFIYF